MIERIALARIAVLCCIACGALVPAKESGVDIVESGPLRFQERLIRGGYGYAYGIAAADLDGDGDLDLTSSDTVADKLLWSRRTSAARRAPSRSGSTPPGRQTWPVGGRWN